MGTGQAAAHERKAHSQGVPTGGVLPGCWAHNTGMAGDGTPVCAHGRALCGFSGISFARLTLRAHHNCTLPAVPCRAVACLACCTLPCLACRTTTLHAMRRVIPTSAAPTSAAPLPNPPRAPMPRRSQTLLKRKFTHSLPESHVSIHLPCVHSTYSLAGHHDPFIRQGLRLLWMPQVCTLALPLCSKATGTTTTVADLVTASYSSTRPSPSLVPFLQSPWKS